MCGDVNDHRMTGDERAVSPVIATVLLLAITVMLSSMVFVLIQSSLSTAEKAPPTATLTVQTLDSGHHVVRIGDLDRALAPRTVQFILQPVDGNGSQITDRADSGEVFGRVGSNVSFQDRDAGYSVNSGDYFVIDSTTLGTDDGNWRFIVVHDLGPSTSQDVIASVTLPAMET